MGTLFIVENVNLLEWLKYQKGFRVCAKFAVQLSAMRGPKSNQLSKKWMASPT